MRAGLPLSVYVKVISTLACHLGGKLMINVLILFFKQTFIGYISKHKAQTGFIV